jgi:hypothetical protein
MDTLYRLKFHGGQVNWLSSMTRPCDATLAILQAEHRARRPEDARPLIGWSDCSASAKVQHAQENGAWAA